MDGNEKVLAVYGTCLIMLAVILLAAGCLDDTDTGTGMAAISQQDVPEGYVQFRNDAMGYAIAAPEGWDVQLVADTNLLVQEPDTASSIVIWPVYLGGENARATAVGLTSYTAGQFAAQHPGFSIESIKMSPDTSIVEVVGSYPAAKSPKKVVMTTTVKGGSGLFVAYEAPSSTFAAQERVMRRIISTFTLTSPRSPVQTTPDIPLTIIQPQVYYNPWLPQFPGGITLGIPQGWVAYQQQADTCSINWWAGEDEKLMTQVFTLSQFLVFRSEKEKSDQIAYWRLYGASGQQYVTLFQNMPVQGNVGPDSFLTGVLPRIGQSENLQQYYPNLYGISDVRIIEARPLDTQMESLFTTSMNAIAQQYDFTFTKAGVPMKGSAIVWATDFSGMPWWNAGMWCVFAPQSEYLKKEPVLIKVFESASVTPAWQRACIEVSEYQANVRQQVFEERQKSQDRIAEKWDDVILDRDRLYNPDTGDVYQVDISFPDYYKANRENFEMQNLRELEPAEWAQIPLDGQFYIR